MSPSRSQSAPAALPKVRPGRQGLYDPASEHDSCGVGFVADIKGRRSHQIISDADIMLRNMDHRGACGCEPNTGDGAGILTALPFRFLHKVASSDLGLELPPPGRFAAGLVFLPTSAAERGRCKRRVEEIIAQQGQQLVGWRKVPVCPLEADLGPTAVASMPVIEQLFVAAGEPDASRFDSVSYDSDTFDLEAFSSESFDAEAFERRLYLIRKSASNELRSDSSLEQREMFYISSLSTKVIVYKGMLTPAQLLPFYPDLSDPDFTSHLAMVHSRFSTNTFPSWDRAQPNRFMAHNGEINTLRGNVNWMHAREGTLKSELFGQDLEQLFPIIEPDCSDSGSFDNVLEFLLMNDRTLQAAVMMMVPEAWQNDPSMSAEKRAFYEYHSCLMEPWDGPASITFTDGHYIGAVLDRNGLRPSRYYVTHDDIVMMASEVGVLPVAADRIKEKGRLQPGRMFLVDFEQGRIVDDLELKDSFAGRRPYSQWLEEQMLDLESMEPVSPVPGLDASNLIERQRAAGYTIETWRFLLRPLVQEQRDPVGSMGNDAALACFSHHPRLLYDYFKQLFAQVTNPAVDSIRERVILSLECPIGPEGNLLEVTAEHCRRLRLRHPILSNSELAAIRDLGSQPDRLAAGWRAKTLDATWAAADGGSGMEYALRRIAAEAEAAVEDGCALVVLSDRGAGPDRVALPSLLACGAVHQHLLDTVQRTRVGLIVETAEAREVHHHCLLIGYGADAINPYLAFETLWQARREGRIDPTIDGDDELVARYKKGVDKGVLKVMGKMGISTLHSYKGAQIFEAIGLHQTVIDLCFAGTASRIQGVGFEVLAQEALQRHRLGYPRRSCSLVSGQLPNPGEFHWRPGGELHMWDPPTIAAIQSAARDGDPDAYRQFADLANERAVRLATMRGVLEFDSGRGRGEVALSEVEPASAIVRRFCTGAMSFGSISAKSHETLAVAMNRLGGKSNTGEGGEDPARFEPDSNGDSRRSAIKQVASGRFGVTAWYLTNSDELQIKIAQGAKPGEGGELPGYKVDETIARIRCATPGVGLISPPPHHDIYSIEDLSQLIYDLKSANPEARVSVKLVSEAGVGTVAAGVVKAHADHILISGHDGGTGASPLTSIKHAGMPWELGLAETHQTLVLNDLRSRVVLQTDGQLKTGRDVVMAALLGAEEFGFSTAPLIALGCIMMRKCHLNTCPVGIATQDPVLQERFAGQPEHVVTYLFQVAEDTRRIMAGLGFRTLEEMVGHSEILVPRAERMGWKAQYTGSDFDFTAMLEPARAQHSDVGVVFSEGQDHGLEHALDQRLIADCGPALEHGVKVDLSVPIRNTDRAVGATLSHEVMKSHGEKGLPDGTVRIRLHGSAGQSFGAFLAPGVTMELEGDANDYVGKGLSGGRVVVRPPDTATFVAEDNILVGNVVLYGATGGEAFFRGRAAERFCVRNSGARCVVEGVGDHGCEYMTGGRVAILGPTGRNFAAGMSGGLAWVWDPKKELEQNINGEMVSLLELDDLEPELLQMIQQHLEWTGSAVAARLLEGWGDARGQFVQVTPDDYRRVLEGEGAESATSKSVGVAA